MIKDKAMIIIAVSKYTGSYSDLPGVITSARKLYNWAIQSEEDCNYKVLYLGDDEYEKIDTNLVCTKVRDFLDNNFINRLVVYFAGHGIVRSVGDQYWLLSDAAIDSIQGIDVERFRRGLLKYNIGSHQDDFEGQLCIIADACRNTASAATEFVGHPILTRTTEMNRNIQYDRFLSTTLGNYSFQIESDNDEQAYCLFSEVLIEALAGKAKDAVQTEFHQYQPAVTNHKLSQYLKKEVKKRSNEIGEDMVPDTTTGIHPPFNYYKKLTEPLNDADFQSTEEFVMPVGSIMSINEQSKRDEDGALNNWIDSRKQTIEDLKQRISSDYIRFLRDVNPSNSIILSDFSPKAIALPNKDSTCHVFQKENLYNILVRLHYGFPVLIQQDEKWIIIPNYPNVVSVISNDLPCDVLFLKTGESIENNQLWDSYLSDFSNLAGSIPLRAEDALKFADKIRVGKEKYPHQSVTAGYLYEFSNDYANITRTAHYMVENTGTVPFDLALLCAEKIFWRSDYSGYKAYADLPEIGALPNTQQNQERPSYTKKSFDARKNVPLLGMVPIFSQGWKFMHSERYLGIPDEIREISENISGRSAANLSKEGLEFFIRVFNYNIVDLSSGLSAEQNTF